MTPRPRTPDPHPEAETSAGGAAADDLPPSRSRSSRRHISGCGGSSSPTRRIRHAQALGGGAYLHSDGTHATPTQEDLAERYGPASASSLQRHLLSPVGGGWVVRRPVVERTLRRVCTLVLPSLRSNTDDTEKGAAKMSSGLAEAAGSAEAATLHKTQHSDPDSLPRQPSSSSLAAIAAADDHDAQSVSSHLSHATGTTAPVSNTTAGASASVRGDSSQQQQQQQPSIEQSFPPPRPNFAPGCQPQIVFGRYVAAATDDGRVCLWTVKIFEENLDITGKYDHADKVDTEDCEGRAPDELEWIRERMRRIEDERAAVEPVATIGPFRVGGGLLTKSMSNPSLEYGAFDDLPATIVALTATPARTAMPTYRWRKRRHQNLNSENAEDDRTSPPPPPPSKPGHSFLGHMAVLSSEGDIHVLECHENNDSRGRLSVTVLVSFSTMEFCATCLCLRPAPPKVEGNLSSSPFYRISIGHDTGLIAEFEVEVAVDTPFAGFAGIRRPTLASSSNEGGSDVNSGNGQIRNETKEQSPSKSKDDAKRADMKMDALSAAAGALDKIAEANRHSKRRESEINENESKDADNDVLTSPSSSPSRPTSKHSEEVVSTTEKPPELRYSLPRPRLRWAGNLDTPIRGLSSVGNINVATEESGTGDIAEYRYNHLVVGLLQRTDSSSAPIISTPPPSSTIEVLDTKQAEVEWNVARSGQSGSNQSSGLGPVGLDDHCTWPGVGMEIRDTSSIPELQKEGKSEYMATRTAKELIAAKCIALEGGTSPMFALALTNGSAAAAQITRQPDGTLAWGIAHHYNQICLPAASIGMGFFPEQINGEKLRNREFVAYSLQGGIVFLVPITTPTTASPEILMYKSPCDQEDSDFDSDYVKYAQGFFAGDLLVDGWQSTIPVVAFSSSGGVIDVLCCDSVSGLECGLGRPHANNWQSDAHLANIILRSSEDLVASLVKNFLLTEIDDDLLRDAVWREAWDECQRYGISNQEEEGTDTDAASEEVVNNIFEGIKNLSDDRFKKMRALLSSFC